MIDRMITVGEIGNFIDSEDPISEISELEPKQNHNRIITGKNRNFWRFWLTRTAQTEKN